MIHGENLRLGIRSLLRRPAESVLLAVAVALAVAASVAGITLAGTSATISERLLTSIRFREIAVTTMAASATMDALARSCSRIGRRSTALRWQTSGAIASSAFWSAAAPRQINRRSFRRASCGKTIDHLTKRVE